jgi:F-type H+-transporting ATPase subunit epsilon
MKLYIYSKHKTLFDGRASAVTIPSDDGELTILKNHVPLITTLKAGAVTIRHGEHDTSETITITKGFAKIDSENTILLIEQ